MSPIQTKLRIVMALFALLGLMLTNFMLASAQEGETPAMQLTPESTTPAPAPAAATAAITGVVVDAAILNVRGGPGLEYPLLTTLALGQNVAIIGRDIPGTWLQVRLPDGRSGWVSSQFLLSNSSLTNVPVADSPVVLSAPVTTTNPAAGVGGPALGTVIEAAILNVRAGPSLNDPIVTTLPLSQTVTLEGRNADGSWLLVRLADGQLGWVSSGFIAANLGITRLPVVDPSTVPITATLPTTQTTTLPGVGGQALGTVVNANPLNVRGGPGLTFPIVSTLALGESVVLEGRDAGGLWLQVRLADGRLGWVSSAFMAANLTIANLPVTN
jgi:N-acetylmuramoyl-L-alanine amidase